MMNAGLGRFVLLSAALHLGVLAAVATRPAPPLFQPAAMTVTLKAVSDAAAPAPRAPAGPAPALHNHRRAPHPVEPPAPLQEDTPQPDNLSPLTQAATPEELEDEEASPAHTQTISADPLQISRQETEAVPAPRLDESALSSRLQGRLRSALTAYFTYPLMARRKGWQGQVQVGLRVESDGRLSHLHITRSSGYRLLDSAALTTLSRIDALPDAAGWLEGRHFDMVLPIEYQLIDRQG